MVAGNHKTCAHGELIISVNDDFPVLDLLRLGQSARGRCFRTAMLIGLAAM